MKSYVMPAGSRGLDDLKVEDRPEPEAGPGEVVVRMRAASLNYRDQAVITGNYFGGVLQQDTVPLSDGAGEVTAVGAGVTRFKPGDRVVNTFFDGWIDGSRPKFGGVFGSPLDGVLAESKAFNEESLLPIPDHLSFEEAASLPCAGLTAWHALVEAGGIKPGDTVLCLGTGGVSIFALQYAKAAGARVIITSSSDEKLERAKALGADDGINYKKTPEWSQEVAKLTNEEGADIVVEVGGAGTLPQSYQSIGFGGVIALIGVLAAPEGDLSPHPMMLRGGRLQGVFVGNRRMFEEMNRALSVNQLKPIVDKVFPFDEARQAYEYELAGKHLGKVVIGI